MPLPGRSRRWSASHAQRWAAPGSGQHGEVQRLAVEPAAQHERLAAAGRELLGDVGDDPAVGRRGRREHRRAGRQVAEQRPDAAVVGPEVVAPVGDAVRLVDDEQPGGRRQPRQHGVAEAGVVEPLRADQQHVDLAARHVVVDQLPVVDVAGVDRDRRDAGALRGGDLVAHERQQRADDDRRTGALRAQQRGRDEVDGRLAPAGALHDERPAPRRRPARRSPSTGPRAGRRRSPASARRWRSASSRVLTG